MTVFAWSSLLFSNLILLTTQWPNNVTEIRRYNELSSLLVKAPWNQVLTSYNYWHNFRYILKFRHKFSHTWIQASSFFIFRAKEHCVPYHRMHSFIKYANDIFAYNGIVCQKKLTSFRWPEVHVNEDSFSYCLLLTITSKFQPLGKISSASNWRWH